jgi:hypothetical protein
MSVKIFNGREMSYYNENYSVHDYFFKNYKNYLDRIWCQNSKEKCKRLDRAQCRTQTEKSEKPENQTGSRIGLYIYKHIQEILTKTIFALISPVGTLCGLHPPALVCHRTPDS